MSLYYTILMANGAVSIDLGVCSYRIGVCSLVIGLASLIIGVLSLCYSVKGYNMSKEAKEEANEARKKAEEANLILEKIEKKKEMANEWEIELKEIKNAEDDKEKIDFIFALIDRMKNNELLSKKSVSYLMDKERELNLYKDSAYTDLPSAEFNKSNFRKAMASAIGALEACVDELS